MRKLTIIAAALIFSACDEGEEGLAGPSKSHESCVLDATKTQNLHKEKPVWFNPFHGTPVDSLVILCIDPPKGEQSTLMES